MKTALITGITGQDGAYLGQFLLKKGYKVYGTYRRLSSPNFWRMEELGVRADVEMLEMDLHDTGNIIRVLQTTRPDELYNLASQSFVAVSFEKPILTGEVTGLGVTRVLEGIRIVNPGIKFYQASSSEMFGKAQEVPQNERTPFYPRSPYAVAKLYGHWMTMNFREAFGIFGCSGILFNHESPLRGIEFVTRKITDAVARIDRGLQDYVELGCLDAKRDWGYAPEYVDAMHRMLQGSAPDNYVIATNSNHSVRDFVEAAFRAVDKKITWEGKGVEEVGRNAADGRTLVRINPRYYRPAEVDMLLGDYSKAKRELGWEPKTSFEELVRIMVESDLRKVSLRI